MWPNQLTPPDVSEFLKPIRPNSDEQTISAQFWANNNENTADHLDLKQPRIKIPTTNRWEDHKDMNPAEEDYVMSDESVAGDENIENNETMQRDEGDETMDEEEDEEEREEEVVDDDDLVTRGGDVECNKNVWSEKWTWVENERIFINWTIDTIQNPTNKATRAIRSRSDKSDSRTYDTVAFR